MADSGAAADFSTNVVDVASHETRPNCGGDLVRLKTDAEMRARDDTLEIYVAEILSKHTKLALESIKFLIPDKQRISMTHLRRVSAASYLPEHLVERLAAAKHGGRKVSEKKPSNGERPKSSNGERTPKSQKTLFLLLCPTSYADHATVSATLAGAFAANMPPIPAPQVHVISAPLFAPTSQEQADRWTATFWPTIFKNSNPYGPHPADLSRAEAELLADDDCGGAGASNVAHWMRVALRAAAAGRRKGLGEEVGVVVVERSDEHGARVVAAAADARWCGIRDEEAKSSARAAAGPAACNVMGHAVMRAIGMVGQKRRLMDRRFAAAAAAAAEALDATATAGVAADAAIAAEGLVTTVDDVPLSGADTPPASDGTVASIPTPDRDPRRPIPVVKLPPPPPSPPEPLPVPEAHPGSATPFLDLPLTPLERACFANPALTPRGYLCLNLELYATHEPCVMCSMALLHSRFGRVIFWRAMPRTGALVVERPVEAPPPAPTVPAGPFKKTRRAGRRGRGGKLAKTPEQQQKHQEKHQEKQKTLQQKKLLKQGPQQPWPVSSSYGLFWRPQLNWKFPCWQWRPDQAALRVVAAGLDAGQALRGLRRLRIEDSGHGEDAADDDEDGVGLDASRVEPVVLDETTHA